MMIYSQRLQQAIKFAVKTHEVYQKQKRKGKDIAYITHPLTVGLILSQAGASEEVVMAGILHDTIEDSVEKKKVTKAMLIERFGDRVADLVEAVTEKDKSLPWEVRKARALEHVKTMDHDMLLVKSADVLQNGTELVADYEKEGDNVFKRFNAPADQKLFQQIRLIRVMVEKWEKNPLKDELLALARNLQAIPLMANIINHPAAMIDYEDYSQEMSLTCPVCRWEGTPETSGWIEHHEDVMDVSCPICEKMLLVISYPLVK